MTDLSGINTMGSNNNGNYHRDNRILNSVINELLNSIDDDEIENSSIYNPFSPNNIGRNYTIGRNVERGSNLFDMVNQLFDVSSNSPINLFNNLNHQGQPRNNEEEETQETSDTEPPLIEEITFHITYPMTWDSDPSNNEDNTDNEDNEHDEYTRITRTRTRNIINNNNNNNNSYMRNSTNSIDNRSFNRGVLSPLQTFTNGTFTNDAFQRILTQSLYDQSSYKTKISETGKEQLIHIHFNKNNKEILNTTCPIMQTEFEEDQYIIMLPCNHTFTPSAINKWLDEKPECPVCRFKLDSIEEKRVFENNTGDNLNNNNNNPSFTTNPHFYVVEGGLQNRTVSYRPLNMNDISVSNSNVYLPYPPQTPTNNDVASSRTVHRMNINQYSYLDYLYEEFDNEDFQRALILSYREMNDLSNNNNDADEISTIVESSSEFSSSDTELYDEKIDDCD
jgi:hypothetical protein